MYLKMLQWFYIIDTTTSNLILESALLVYILINLQGQKDLLYKVDLRFEYQNRKFQ